MHPSCLFLLVSDNMEMKSIKSGMKAVTMNNEATRERGRGRGCMGGISVDSPIDICPIKSSNLSPPNIFPNTSSGSWNPPAGSALPPPFF